MEIFVVDVSNIAELTERVAAVARVLGVAVLSMSHEFFSRIVLALVAENSKMFCAKVTQVHLVFSSKMRVEFFESIEAPAFAQLAAMVQKFLVRHFRIGRLKHDLVRLVH